MRSSDRCSRVAAGVAIAIAHAAVLYTAATFAPTFRSSPPERPLAATFIPVSAPSKPRWSPAPPAAPELLTLAPTLAPPQLEVAVSPAVFSRAIDVAPAAEPAQSGDSVQTHPMMASVEYVREPEPRYPPQSRRLKEQGVVVLRVVIDESGRACEIEVATSSGYARLDRAAREAVARAAFRPYVEGGAPRRAMVLVPIEFFLNPRTV